MNFFSLLNVFYSLNCLCYKYCMSVYHASWILNFKKNFAYFQAKTTQINLD